MKKFLIKVNGTQYEVEVEEIREGNQAAQPADNAKTSAPAPAPVSVPKSAEPKKNNAVPDGGSVITAPMPGTVLKVNVNVGDVVKKGQVLLILEAMKMENEIVAQADGRIVSVNVEKSKSVNAGDVLVAIA